MLRILLVGHYPLLRVGIQLALKEIEDLCFFEEEAESDNSTELCEQLSPNVILVNPQSPGIQLAEITAYLRLHYPQARLLLLLDSNGSQIFNAQEIMYIGVGGALLIDESIESLINGIRMVGYNRGLWFSESLIAQQLVKNARESSILLQSISTSPSQSLGRVITVGALQLDVMQRQVLYKQQAIPLSKLECDFLAYLVQRVNQVCSYDELLDAVWGYEKTGDPHLVQLVAHRVRQKLKQTVSYNDTVLIETVRGIGLCLSYRENSDTIN